MGSSFLDGPWGVSQEAALAASAVIAICEHEAPAQVVRHMPNRSLIPSTKVVAVVVEPGGCHPSPLQGEYGRDHEFFHEYHAATRTAEGFDAWIAEWVTGVSDRAACLRK